MNIERVIIEKEPYKSPEEALVEYLSYKDFYKNPPKVKLQRISRSPKGKPDVSIRDAAGISASQCYEPGISLLQPPKDTKTANRLERIADSTEKSFHLTTRHDQFQFHLEGVSRSVVHDLLHANPFYNSSQQSQRYVEAKAGNYLQPKLGKPQEALFNQCADYQNSAYFELLSDLRPEAEKRVKEMYPESGWKVEKTKRRLDGKVGKLCQEIARYVLPIGQCTNLQHTISEIQLLRLFQASQMPHFSHEARYIVAEMVNQVAKSDSSILKELRIPEKATNRVYSEEEIFEQKQYFDRELNFKTSHLVSMDDNSESILAESVRNILGNSSLEDEEVLDQLLNPENNPYLASSYETGMIDPLTTSLREIGVTFKTRLSHTADSQRQRQRRTPAATPPIEAVYDGIQGDFVTPLAIRENDTLNRKYQEYMKNIYRNVANCIEAGIPKEYALLLLPNAQAIRLTESGDLFDWIHRWKQRLCSLAQEEIFFISIDQVEQVTEILPDGKDILLAPCGIRKKARISPRCPEGERWCGQPVFNFEKVSEYREKRKI